MSDADPDLNPNPQASNERRHCPACSTLRRMYVVTPNRVSGLTGRWLCCVVCSRYIAPDRTGA